MELLFASKNPNKIKEIQSFAGKDIKIIGLNTTGIDEDIPENEPTLEDNASAKSWYVFKRTGKHCFADDTGLEIEALDGKPGVHSARYSGMEKNDDANIRKVLHELQNVSNRKARFRTVISLIIGGKEKLFEGTVYGEIIEQKRGNKGFGYDPVFVPDGYDKTFAEMSLEEKNSISHRTAAVVKLVEYLRKNLLI